MADVRVGVVGATGALGGELLKVLDRAPWRPDDVVAMARASSSASHVEYGDARLAVDDTTPERLEGLDLVYVATPEAAALTVGAAAIAAGVPVVDLSGAWARRGDGPVVIPWVNGEDVDTSAGKVVSTPSAAAIAIAAVLGPLARGGLSGRCQATVLLPASHAGREGIDELSRQVTALFNAATPPRKVFPHGLAFDVLPAWSAPEANGWTAEEAQVAAEVAITTRWSGGINATLVGAPVFSGLSATIVLHLDRRSSVETVLGLLRDGGTGVAESGLRAMPRPRRVDGMPFVQVGRVRLDADGGIHLWLAMDNLRATATVAVALGAAMLGERLHAD